MLENLTAFLESLKNIINDDICKDYKKRKLVFAPLLNILKVTTLFLGKLGR